MDLIKALDEVEGIENGKCYVFPKIDGTCSTVFLDDNGEVAFGSRKRQLTLDKDNAGFMARLSSDDRVADYLRAHPTHRLYGEWLVPHSLKTYEDDAWRKFYVFDVVDCEKEGEGDSVYSGYIPYDEYYAELELYKIDYIPAMSIIENGTPEDFIKMLDDNNYLIKEGEGLGEGIVIKRYDYINKYGRTTWAKIVRNDFREQHKTNKPQSPMAENNIENRIATKYITRAFVEKEFAKLKEAKGGWNSKYIPELLNRIYYEFINEDMWHVLKDFKNPTIDFKKLQRITTELIKNFMKEMQII